MDLRFDTSREVTASVQSSAGRRMSRLQLEVQEKEARTRASRIYEAKKDCQNMENESTGNVE